MCGLLLEACCAGGAETRVSRLANGPTSLGPSRRVQVAESHASHGYLGFRKLRGWRNHPSARQHTRPSLSDPIDSCSRTSLPTSALPPRIPKSAARPAYGTYLETPPLPP